jgi:hypothetical protein
MKKLIILCFVLLIGQLLNSQTLSEKAARRYFEKGKFKSVRVAGDSIKNTNEPLKLDFYFTTKRKEYSADSYIFYKNLIPDDDYYSLTKDGLVKINAEYLSQDSLYLSFHLMDNPELACSLIVDLDQKGELCIDYSGIQGEKGMTPESSRSEDGAPGLPGEKGGDGSNGHDLSIFVSLHNDDLLKILVNDLSVGHTQEYFAKTEGVKVKIVSNGGNGGNGGDGSIGSKGRPFHANYYVNGRPMGGCFSGGPGGVGGPGGCGGDCGSISITFSKEVAIYADSFSYEQLPGDGGVGGSQGSQGPYGEFTTDQGRVPCSGNFTEYQPIPSKEGKPGECFGLLSVKIEE